MAKTSSQFVCAQCGAWNSLAEEVVARPDSFTKSRPSRAATPEQLAGAETTSVLAPREVPI